MSENVVWPLKSSISFLTSFLTVKVPKHKNAIRTWTKTLSICRRSGLRNTTELGQPARLRIRFYPLSKTIALDSVLFATGDEGEMIPQKYAKIKRMSFTRASP